MTTPTLDPRLEAEIARLLPTADSLAWEFYCRAPHVLDVDELKSITREALVISAARWVDPYCSSRGYYPWSADGSKPESHFIGFAVKRMRGALLDHARSNDFITRSMRHKAKALTRAQDSGAQTLEEQAAAAGLSVDKAREVRALVEIGRPVSLEGETGTGLYADSAAVLADDTHEGDVEGQAAVNGILAGFLAVLDRMDAETRVILALRYFRELDFTVIAELMFTDAGRVRELHEAGVLAVHDALLMAVS